MLKHRPAADVDPAHRLVQRNALRDKSRQPLAEGLGTNHTAGLAQPAHETLGDDSPERGGDFVRLHSYVHQSGHRIGSVVGVQRR